jgi:hypothetical protein
MEFGSRNAEVGRRGMGQRAWREGQKLRNWEGGKVGGRKVEGRAGRLGCLEAGKLLAKNISLAPDAYSILPNTFYLKPFAFSL